ncbi:hypothetical protein PACTADRAFT_76864 [Pachysolen tannophilus NRRL Y-2460]|uniref:Sodium/calcium exchanger membrane region domain-containing protein n=1 Tax=Pachysolen tannophilus NRRL Y-2460 TaxID=669874 RepID=A0A1E4TR51_PACTA|nr:hypothetical protein PACTADRAFT_76864 [Pachysolen tannophilus NRRL Y-2460]
MFNIKIASLVTRVLVLVSGVSASGLTIDDDVENDVCKLPIPFKDEYCQYIVDNCNLRIFNYSKLYYCSSYDHGMILLMLFSLLIVFFITLGIITSNFLSPNLAAISSILQLNERIAGLTLLSLGNGAPDIFSTYQAMSSNSTSLAIGELIGSCNFVTCFIVGLMGITNPFKVHGAEFLKDLIFFMLLLLMSFTFLQDGKLTLLECGFMCWVYICYIVFLVVYNLKKNAELQLYDDEEQSIRNSPQNPTMRLYSPSSNNVDESNNLELIGKLNRYLKFGNLPRLSVFDSLKFLNMEQESNNITDADFGENVLNNNDANIAYDGNDGDDGNNNTQDHEELHQESSTKNNNLLAAPKATNPALSRITEQLLLSRSTSYNSIQNTIDDLETDGRSPVSPISHISVPHMAVYTQTNDEGNDDISSINKEGQICYSLGDYLFPELNSFKSKKLYEIILALVSTPIIFLLSLFMPVYHEPEEMNLHEKSLKKKEFELKLKLLNLNLTLLPFLINDFSILQSLITDFTISESDRKILTSSLIIASLNLIGYFIFKNFEIYHRIYKHVLPILGFISSLFFITIMTSQIIKILKNLGLVFEINESLLGLTVLSLGNSIGDLISNLTLCSLGFQLTCLNACFGSPLMYMLLGVGLNGLIIITSNYYQGDHDNLFIEFEVNDNLNVSAIGLLVILVFYIIVIPFNNWNFGRKIGMVGVSWWVLITLVNIGMEGYT